MEAGGPLRQGTWTGALRSPPFTEHLGKEKEDQAGLGRACKRSHTCFDGAASAQRWGEGFTQGS